MKAGFPHQGAPCSVVNHLALLALFAPSALSTLLAKWPSFGIAPGAWHCPCEPVLPKAEGVLVYLVVSNQPREFVASGREFGLGMFGAPIDDLPKRRLKPRLCATKRRLSRSRLRSE